MEEGGEGLRKKEVVDGYGKHAYVCGYGYEIRWEEHWADLLTSRCAISTFSTFQLLIMKYLVSNVLQRLMSERSLFSKKKKKKKRRARHGDNAVKIVKCYVSSTRLTAIFQFQRGTADVLRSTAHLSIFGSADRAVS